MPFFSFYFLIFFTLLVLAFYGSRSNTYRRVVLSAGNLVFLVSFLPSAASCIAIASFAVASYGALAVQRRWRRWPWVIVFVPAVVIFLLYARRYQLLAALVGQRAVDHAWEIIGISYMSFKLIHMLVDLRQDQIAPFTLGSYLNYQLGFYCIVAGPIQRYNDFHAFWANVDRGYRSETEGLGGLSRLFSGMIKMGLLAMLAFFVYDTGLRGRAGAGAAALLQLAEVFYAYPAYVYLNFAGYSDIVIGAAAVLGMAHQENFNHPYVARNLIDFWSRWHISLTLWIRDYVFMTSYKAVAQRWPAFAGKAAYLLLFLALFIAGLWHGGTWNFVLFGLVHGVGVAAVQIYGDMLRAKLGREGFQAYLRRPVIRVVAIVITLNYVCFSFLFFRPGLRSTFELIVDRLGRAF